jgi:hypothetical protein
MMFDLQNMGYKHKFSVVISLSQCYKTESC